MTEFKRHYKKSCDNLRSSLRSGGGISLSATEAWDALAQLDREVSVLWDAYQHLLANESLLSELAPTLVNKVREIEKCEIPGFKETRYQDQDAMISFLIFATATVIFGNFMLSTLPLAIFILVVSCALVFLLVLCVEIIGPAFGSSSDRKIDQENALPFTVAKEFAAKLKEDQHLQFFFAKSAHEENAAADASEVKTEQRTTRP